MINIYVCVCVCVCVDTCTRASVCKKPAIYDRGWFGYYANVLKRLMNC